MSLSPSWAGKVRRSTPALCRPLVAGPESRRLLIRSSLVAVFCGAVFALVVFAGFITAPTYPVGIAPICVAVGDFNGDGIPDLAVANLTNIIGAKGTVSILLGNGDGTFQDAQNYTVGVQASSVVVGDFDGDGHLDLAVANAGSGTASILLGNGDGTFQDAQSYATGGRAPNSLTVGDFNADGILDLAVVNTNGVPGPGTVSILLGNGDGSFQAPQAICCGRRA